MEHVSSLTAPNALASLAGVRPSGPSTARLPRWNSSRWKRTNPPGGTTTFRSAATGSSLAIAKINNLLASSPRSR